MINGLGTSDDTTNSSVVVDLFTLRKHCLEIAPFIPNCREWLSASAYL